MDFGLNSRLCAWVFNFLTGRPQVVRFGRSVSNTITQELHKVVYSALCSTPSTPLTEWPHTALTLYCKISCRHCGDGLHLQQRCDSLHAGGEEPVIVVSGEQLQSKYQQNQRADSRLQQETAAALHTPHHQWDCSGEGEQY